MIIDSILDNDLYKFTMQQVIFHQYYNPNALLKQVRYEFVCRDQNVDLLPIKHALVQEIKAMDIVRLTPDEYVWLSNHPKLKRIFKPDYLEYLMGFRFRSDMVRVYEENGKLKLKIDGPWIDTILYEVPLLAIISELYAKYMCDADIDFLYDRGIEGLIRQGVYDLETPLVNHKKVTEFGTRRRFSKHFQNLIWEYHNYPQVGIGYPNNFFSGTSNLLIAKTFGADPIGTMAHEFISGHLGLVNRNIGYAQKKALYSWLIEYGKELGIALSDTFTSKAFFDDFDDILANGYSGVRHDSGDPYRFGLDVIAHYKKLGIDPQSKIIVFSDGLDYDTANDLYLKFRGLINVSFGIGTSLTNPFKGVGCRDGKLYNPLNIVIKLIECNGTKVCKLSDVPTKAIGDPNMIAAVKKHYGIK